MANKVIESNGELPPTEAQHKLVLELLDELNDYELDIPPAYTNATISKLEMSDWIESLLALKREREVSSGLKPEKAKVNDAVLGMCFKKAIDMAMHYQTHPEQVPTAVREATKTFYTLHAGIKHELSQAPVQKVRA